MPSLAYHFLFVFALSFSLLYTPGLSPAELARTLALSVYQAPMIMGFQVGLDDYTPECNTSSSLCAVPSIPSAP